MSPKTVYLFNLYLGSGIEKFKPIEKNVEL